MLIVSGTIPMKADKIEEAKAAALVMQKATQLEDGCITYCFYQDIEDPSIFRVFEEWESQAHLEAHGKTEHMAEFRAALADIVAGAGNVFSYEVSSQNKL